MEGGSKNGTKNSSKANPGSGASKKWSKNAPPLRLPSSIPPPPEIFSSRKHSMDYVTVNGVVMRTGYDDKNLWYLLDIKEQLDNGIDYLWKKYQGAGDDRTITAEFTLTNDSLFHTEIRNSNTKNIPVFQNLKATLDYDMRFGSKQNQHIISRGMLGDAMKQILTWPYVLIHAKDDGTAFTDEQWTKPLIVRCNKIEREIFLQVNKAKQEILAHPIKESDTELSFTDTEIETTWPIIDGVNLDIHRIEEYCRQYIIFTTDVSFKFKLVDNSTDKVEEGEREGSEEEEEEKTNNNDFASELITRLSSPARKAAIEIDVPALHTIAKGWSNITSIHWTRPEEFIAAFESVYDKQGTTVYDVLYQYREGHVIRKSPENQISVAELMDDPNKYQKIQTLFWLLRETLKLSEKEKISLPYSNIKIEDRKQALTQRIDQLYPNILDTTKAIYKPIPGFYNDDDWKKVWSADGTTYQSKKGTGMVHFPFMFEIIAIPLSEKLLDENTNRPSKFIGAVNYSVSPGGVNKFEGDYNWVDKKGYPVSAKNITDILYTYGFRFYPYSDNKIKRPCIIAANLVSYRFEYQGHSKSRIDTHPFTSAIIEGCRKIAEEIQTFSAAGYHFVTERELKERRPPNKQYSGPDIMMEVLRRRKQEMGL
jgi:hypothetical protein